MLDGSREPRIVFWDLETLPNLPEVLKVYPQLGNYPGLTLKASITSIICFGYAILGESNVNCINAWDYADRWLKDRNDDYEIIKAAREVLASADAIVTHNGKRFDWKFLQTRLMIHGLEPLPKIPHIDTCSIAKQHLYLFNNKLNTLGEFIAGDQKIDNGGWKLWVDVWDRKLESLELMTTYCKQDVLLLVKLFKKLKPLIPNIPNYNLFTVGMEKVCPSCGSTRLLSNGIRVTKTSRYRRYNCLDCGAASRTDVNDRMPRAI